MGNVQASHLWDSGIHLFKTHKNPANGRNPQTLCAQNDPIEAIAGLRCAPLERQQEPTKEQQQNTNKQHLCACCLCSNALKTSNDCYFSNEIFGKSQKSKRFPLFDFFDFSTFRCFRPLVFFLNLSRFSTFRAKIHWTASFAFFFLEFSTFRGRKVCFSRCDCYQPEGHTEIERAMLQGDKNYCDRTGRMVGIEGIIPKLPQVSGQRNIS